MMKPFAALAATGLLVLATGELASAQVPQSFRPERPYRGIFANGTDNSTQSLVGTGSVSAGYDDDLLAAATNRNHPVSNQHGFLGQLSGGLNYALNVDRATLNAGVGSSARYYPSLPDDYFESYYAGLSGVYRLLRKPEVSVSGGAHYLPQSFLSAFPALDDGASPEVPGPDYVPVEAQYVSYNAGISANQRLSQRTTLSTAVAYRSINRLDHDFWSDSAQATLRYRMNRDMSLRFGYTFSEGHYSNREPVQVHRPDVGVDVAHALSLTRNTSFTFGFGTEATKVHDHTRVRVTGNASLLHEIGRSWAARASYHRGTTFVDTLSEPVFKDSAQVSLVGLLTRRIQFTALGSALVGTTTSTSRKFDSYRASVSIGFAMTRYLNAGVDYIYYNYLFDQFIDLPTGWPRDMNRQTIRGHVTMWVPILNQSRRANATR